METKSEKHYAQYCRVRNQVRTLTRKLQKQYELNSAKDDKTNPKVIWKNINSKTMTRQCVSDLYIDPPDDKSRLTNCDKERAEILGKFFSSVFTVAPNGDIPENDPTMVKTTHAALRLVERLLVDEQVGLLAKLKNILSLKTRQRNTLQTRSQICTNKMCRRKERCSSITRLYNFQSPLST